LSSVEIGNAWDTLQILVSTYEGDIKKMKQYKVLIVDDDCRVRDGLVALLATSPGIKSIGEAANGREAVQLAAKILPDVVLMDVQMPEMDGIKATQLIKEVWPKIKIIVLTIDSKYRTEALAAGADTFLVKGFSEETLLKAIYQT
jgi:YesN/AraC family two-component response regulator